jgi:Fe-S cluster assembly protein SufD
MTILSLASESGVLDVTGGILMPPGVKKTQGYLLEENILLHPTARIKALPMLDVRSNDVKASHGAKIHAIDATKLFYMQARGLSHAESKKLYIK